MDDTGQWRTRHRCAARCDPGSVRANMRSTTSAPKSLGGIRGRIQCMQSRCCWPHQSPLPGREKNPAGNSHIVPLPTQIFPQGIPRTTQLLSRKRQWCIRGGIPCNWFGLPRLRNVQSGTCRTQRRRPTSAACDLARRAGRSLGLAAPGRNPGGSPRICRQAHGRRDCGRPCTLSSLRHTARPRISGKMPRQSRWQSLRQRGSSCMQRSATYSCMC